MMLNVSDVLTVANCYDNPQRCRFFLLSSEIIPVVFLLCCHDTACKSQGVAMQLVLIYCFVVARELLGGF